MSGGSTVPSTVTSAPGTPATRYDARRVYYLNREIKGADRDSFTVCTPVDLSLIHILINRCIGGGYNNRGNFWQMTVVTLGLVFCDTGKVSTKEERLEWPVTDEERNSDYN